MASSMLILRISWLRSLRKKEMSSQGLTVGESLRRKREEENISLQSVAAGTRITPRYLQALERDEFHSLMAEVFIRGYLRSYAKFIHLNPEEVLALYQHQREPKENQETDDQSTLPPPTSCLKNLLNFFLHLIPGRS